MMMATTFDSFDASVLGAFVESPLGARNRGPAPVDLFDFAVILVTSGTRVYHPFTWALQQTGFCEDARSNISIGMQLAHNAYLNDLIAFRSAKTQLETLGNVLVGVVYVAVKYDWRNLGQFTGLEPERFACFSEQVDYAHNSARIGLKPPGSQIPNDVVVHRYGNTEGYTIDGFESIVGSLTGGTPLDHFIAMRVGSSGIVIPLQEHVYDAFGDYILVVEISTDVEPPPNPGYQHAAWINDLQRRGLPGQFASSPSTAGNWLVGATGAMQEMYNQFRP